MREYHEVLDTNLCIHVCVLHACMQVPVFMCICMCVCVCEREKERERDREREHTKLCTFDVYARFLCEGIT